MKLKQLKHPGVENSELNQSILGYFKYLIDDLRCTYSSPFFKGSVFIHWWINLNHKIPQAYEMLCPRPRWSCYAMCSQNLRTGGKTTTARLPGRWFQTSPYDQLRLVGFLGFGIHFRWLGMKNSEPSTVPLPVTTRLLGFWQRKNHMPFWLFFCTLTESSGSKNPCRKPLSGGQLWDSMVCCDLSCYPSKPKFLKPCLKLKVSASPDTPEPCLYRFDLFMLYPSNSNQDPVSAICHLYKYVLDVCGSPLYIVIGCSISSFKSCNFHCWPGRHSVKIHLWLFCQSFHIIV